MFRLGQTLACVALIAACERSEPYECGRQRPGSQASCLPPDGAPYDDGAPGCDPTVQTGCPSTEKCAWNTGLDEFDCVPDGSGQVFDLCVVGADGHDDCSAGTTCVAGTCSYLCRSSDYCGDWACVGYEDLFPGTDVGVCEVPCDPVTQQCSVDGSRGCYGVVDGTFSCAPVPPAAIGLEHGSTAYGPAGDAAYVNGCAPGYQALLHSSNDASAPVLCLAYCRPGETYAGHIDDADGVAGSGYTCADREAVTPGTECHYFWSLELEPTAARNGVGFCWQPGDYIGDWDRDPATAETPWPPCATLSASFIDSGDDGIADVAEYRFWGCAPFRDDEGPEVRYASPPLIAIPAAAALWHL